MSLPAGVMDELELVAAGSDIGNITRCCKYSQELLMMGENITGNT
jgi:hypothetical protein